MVSEATFALVNRLSSRFFVPYIQSKGSRMIENDARSWFFVQYIQSKRVNSGREQCWVPVLYTWTYSLKGLGMMQVPHQLGKKVLSVIYMDLQTSALELAFVVESGGFISLYETKFLQIQLYGMCHLILQPKNEKNGHY